MMWHRNSGVSIVAQLHYKGGNNHDNVKGNRERFEIPKKEEKVEKENIVNSTSTVVSHQLGCHRLSNTNTTHTTHNTYYANNDSANNNSANNNASTRGAYKANSG